MIFPKKLIQLPSFSRAGIARPWLGVFAFFICALPEFALTPQTITAGPSTQTAYTGQSTNFFASGSNTGYTWTNATSNGASAYNSWSAAGSQTVTVQAPAGSGYAASNAVTLNVTVMALQAQTITAGPSAQSVYPGQTAYFSASGSNTGYLWVGATGNGSTASASWTTPGTYTVTARGPATGAFASSNTVSMTVTVLAPQPQTISAGPASQSVYPGQYAYFTASGASSGAYRWSGAAVYGNGARQSWTTPGTYTVSVNVFPTDGSYATSNTVTMSVTVLQPRSHTISAWPASQTVAVGQYAYFTVTGGNNANLYSGGYEWINANAVENGMGRQMWTTPGNYTVSVLSPASTDGADAASNTVTMSVTVVAQSSTVTASAPQETVYVNQSAIFSVAGGNMGTGYSWSGAAGSGSNGNGPSATQSWSAPGPESVSVVPTSGFGGATMSVQVMPLLPQTIVATPSVQTVYANQTAYFSVAGSSSGYTWSPGATGNANGASEAWTNPGTYTVSVQAPAGTYYTASNSVSMTVTVLAPQSQTITATPATQTVYVNQTANFSASGSAGGYVWTRATGNGAKASQSWSSPGTNTVLVQAPAVGTNFTASNVVTMTVNVLALQPQTVVGTPTTQNVAAGQTAYFSASGSDSGSYVWTGATSNGNSSTASKSWTNPGTYPVSVQAPANGSGVAASNVATMSVTVESGSHTSNTGTAGGSFLATQWGKFMAIWGGPVELATGAEAFSRPLFSFSGARNWQFGINFNSVLSSSQTTPGLFGYGWSFPYEGSIATSGSNLIVHWDATHNNTFTPVTGSPGTFSSAEEMAEHDIITTNSGGGWTLKLPNQATQVYDSTGRLINDIDPNGRKLVLTYNGSSQLASIADPVSGTSLAFSYNGSGLVSGLTDATGAAVGFTYNSGSLLTKIVNQNAKQVTFTYDANRNILTLTDNNGTLLTTDTYDTSGRVVSQQDGVAGHGPLQFSYQQPSLSSNIVTTATDKMGAVSVYTFDPDYHLLSVQNALNETTSYAYDTAGNLLSKTDALGKTTQYTYDSFGNLLTTTDPAGQITHFAYDSRNNLLTTTDPASHVTTRTYDPNNNLLTLTDALGHTTTWTYDTNSMPLTKKLPRGGTFAYAYTNGRLTQVTDPNGVVNTLSYDADGRLVSRQDSLSNQTTYGYDASGNLLTETNPLSQTTTLAYDYRNRLTSSTDAAGAVKSFTYDNNNNLLSSTDPLGNATTFAYDGNDRLLSTTDPLGHTSAQSYDAAGELVSTTDATGNRTTYGYDAAGHRTQVADPLGNATTISYDPRGLPLTVTDPLTRVTQLGYDNLGRQTSSTDPLNQTTTSTYDAVSRLAGVTDPGTLATAQSFDSDGNRASLTDANGNAASFAYDNGGRMTSATTPAGRTTSYTYDARGLPSTTTLPSGHATTLTYDAAAQPASVADGAGTIAFTRDSDGRVLTVTENGHTLTRTYDQLGRITQYVDGAGNVLKYGYDNAGNLTTLTYPDNKVVTYTHDAAHRLTGVTDWAGRTTTYAYDAAGRLTQTTRPNGTAQVRTYDAAGQLTGLSELAPGGTSAIYAETCSYDGAGRLTAETQAPSLVTGASSVTISAGYNPSSRVTSWQDTLGNQSAYTYDGAANLLTATNQFVGPPPSYTPATGTFDADNRLLSFSGQSASFDPDGNLLSLPGASPASYAYDVRNRLISADALGYGYDSENNRVSLTDATGTTQFVVNSKAALSQVLVRIAPDGTITDYVYGLGLAYEDTAGTARYYHYDRRGNTVALTDASGTLLGQVSYGAYGEILTVAGQTNTPFLFNGLYGVMTDSNGLYYHRARYYSPQLRRFITQDVTLGGISVAASMNRYAYANGNPVNAIDPFGLMAEDVKQGATDVAVGAWIVGKDVEQSAIDVAVGAWVVEKDYAAAVNGVSTWADENIGPDAGNAIMALGLVLPLAAGQPEVDAMIAQGEAAAGLEAVATTSSETVTTVTEGGATAAAPESGQLQPLLLPDQIAAEGAPGVAKAAPDFVVSPGGTVYPVPEGAAGPFPTPNGKGFMYNGGSGGNGLAPEVSNARFMDPTAPKGPSPGYPNGYGSYSNGAAPTPQTVNPYTGKTVAPSSPWWHIPAK